MTISNPKSGIDVGDHPPITPTTNIPNDLQYNDKRIYDYICRHFIASVS